MKCHIFLVGPLDQIFYRGAELMPGPNLSAKFWECPALEFLSSNIIINLNIPVDSLKLMASKVNPHYFSWSNMQDLTVE